MGDGRSGPGGRSGRTRTGTAVKTLADIPVGLVWQAQQAALMRLQLYLVLRTHEMLRGVLADCREALEAAGDSSTSAAASAQNDKQRVWDGLSTHLAIEGVSKAWAKGFGAWKKLFEGLRWEAGALPFGALAVLHDARDWRLEVGEGRARTAVDGVDDGWTRWTTDRNGC
ncbi:MAG: hypothetical protein NTU85_03470 [Candidatus Kaiserbacteria bacterium]|nr:hypothetical protein [Candidatus Kaiserbacteria bacterium]